MILGNLHQSLVGAFEKRADRRTGQLAAASSLSGGKAALGQHDHVGRLLGQILFQFSDEVVDRLFAIDRRRTTGQVAEV